MPEPESLNTFFSRVGFVFVVFVVVSSGYITEILSCQMRATFENSLYLRHVVGILLLFVFIMMEGGWSFYPEEDAQEANNWASGNVWTTMVLAFGLYVIFLISSKSQFWPNLIFFAFLLALYMLNTQREYYYVRKKIDEALNKQLLNIEYVLTGFAGVTMIYGFVDYVFYQMRERGDSFSWAQFLLGGHKCAKLTNTPSLNNLLKKNNRTGSFSSL